MARGGAQRGCGADRGRVVAGADDIYDRARPHQDAGLYKTDESDVGNIRPGKAVTFKVDAFPKDTFHGVVSQVRMNPTTVQSVVTYDTIIEFANPEMSFFRE